jgi:hypothetical protein
MSSNLGLEYPDELKLAVWERKKGSLPSGHEVGDKLKAFQKKHDAVDWKLFDPGWPKAAKTADDLEQAFALRDRLYRGSVFALKKDALAVASAAKSMEKEKGAAKPVLDAAKAIGKAANTYADAVDEGIDALKSIYEKALGAMPKKAEEKSGDKSGEGDGEDDEPGSALLDPKRLVAQLKMCQRTPDRTVQFAYLDAPSKDQPAVLAMHPKMSSTSLFNKLKKETGGKTGAYGSAWVDGTSLMLQLDKPLGGLVKKVRAAVKAAGFRVAKVVLWSADGTVFEQDDEPDKDGDGPVEAMTGAPGGPAAKSILPAPSGGPAAKAAAPAPAAVSPEAAAFMARLKSLLAKAAEFGDPALAQQAKLLGSEAGVALRKGESAKVEQLMTQAEALFVKAKAAPATQPAEPATEPANKTEPKSADDLAAAWQTRFQATEKVYLEVMSRQPADAGKMRAVMDFANGKAESKQYAAAAQALDRLDGMLAKLLSASGSPQEARQPEVPRGTVAKRVFLLERWKKIPVDLRVELGTLLKAIRVDYPQVDLATLGKGIDGKLRALIDASQARLADAIDDDIKSGDAKYGKTAAAIRSVRGDLAAHPMVVALRDNAFTAGSAFETAFGSALDEVQSTLTA